ncbi:MAG: histidine phosphatase family protein [bacterium]
MSQLTLYIARHGETQWNLDQRIQGSTDIPLSAHGEEQAEALAQRLKSVSFDAIYSSDLIRAVRTAEIIKTALTPVRVVQDARLRERNWGSMEGLTWEDIINEHPDDLRQIKSGNIDYTPQGGESRLQVINRVLDWLQEISTAENSTILVITHGGTASIILKHAMGIDQTVRTPFIVENCALNILLYIQRSYWVVETLNDTCHLARRAAFTRNYTRFGGDPDRLAPDKNRK